MDVSERLTLVIGQNNAGKTNALRALAIIFNDDGGAKLDPRIDFVNPTDSAIRVTYQLPASSPGFAQVLARSPRLKNTLTKRSLEAVPVVLEISANGRRVDRARTENEWEAIFGAYDFQAESSELTRSYGDRQHNVGNVIGAIQNFAKFSRGTVYLPSIRYMSRPGQVLPTYNETPFPGEKIEPENIVRALQSFDRPPYEQLNLKENLRQIEKFVGFCIQKRRIAIEVANDASSILVTIDGSTRPLRSLGTGLEHLLMIGATALGFGDKIVLMEEPELHLHPAVQKRIVQYLFDNSKASLFVTTHSASVLDAVPASILHIWQEGDRSRATKVDASAGRFEAVRDLGYRASDIVQSNFAIWVEGPSDRIYLKAWINLIASDLREGTDFSILFYGGRLLSHLAFDDSGIEGDLIQVLPLNRNAAVIIDSDRGAAKAPLTDTKRRIADEAAEIGALCWLTAGREIENYIDVTAYDAARAKFPELSKRRNRFTKLASAKTNKVDLARWLTVHGMSLDVLDLRAKLDELVRAIRRASSVESATNEARP